MTRFNQILVAALVVQFAIAGAIYVGSRPPAAEQIQMALLSADRSEINRIVIAEGDGEGTELGKIDGTWRLTRYHHLPANQSKVDDILARLETTKSGWPVATTASGRERFKVSDQAFEKTITLGHGDDALQKLYLGTSPGFRQIHVRRSGEDAVYAVRLNSFDFPAQHTAWLDKTLLQPKADITGLKGPDFALEKRESNWQLAEGDGEPVGSEIEKLTSALARLNVEAAGDTAVDDSAYELTVTAAGETLRYRLFMHDSHHYISRNDYAQVFRISKADYETITGQRATQLVRQSDPQEQPRDS